MQPIQITETPSVVAGAEEPSLAGGAGLATDVAVATDLMGMSTDDDVADPTGSWAVDHRTTAEEIDALSGAVLSLLFP